MSWVAIGGFAEGLGAGLAEGLVEGGHSVVGISRSGTSSGHASGVACDLTDAEQTHAVFEGLIAERGAPLAYVHNAHFFSRGLFMDTSAASFEHSWRTGVLTAVNAAQAVLPAMLADGRGNLAFMGATASVRAGAQFSAFASAKFALRGLSQSLARELGPRGIHVSHLQIDAVVVGPQAQGRVGRTGDLSPRAVAGVLLHLFGQPTDAWTHELDLRPASERW